MNREYIINFFNEANLINPHLKKNLAVHLMNIIWHETL